ncbi:hypothetical protein P5673_001145 [Acropora cervicornis]|uniref:Uncharacterized protein n=1 Tax=Acropora cervicornis TaxID=6130 RepID=A0AAD9R607_ACRCE|nr:hypothetical protein P5673_001145 [Acropora cervicornis]
MGYGDGTIPDTGKCRNGEWNGPEQWKKWDTLFSQDTSVVAFVMELRAKCRCCGPSAKEKLKDE